MMIKMSNASKSDIICNGIPFLKISPKAVLESLTNIISWGRISGNPNMAIKDAC